MKIERLLISANDVSVVSEWSTHLEGVPIIGICNDVGTTDLSLLNQAKNGAQVLANKWGIPTLFDMERFQIDALQNLTVNKLSSEEFWEEYVLRSMYGTNWKKRGASLEVAAALAIPNGGVIFQDQNRFDGKIAHTITGNRSSERPYMSIFRPDQIYDDLTDRNLCRIEDFRPRKKIADTLLQTLSQQSSRIA